MSDRRKRILKKLKRRFFISITPIPKVRIKVTFRTDGSWHWDFGHISHKYLVDSGQMYNESGEYICTVPHFWCGGQDYVIKRLWLWIKEAAYDGKIHELDLV
jgi:hypothetical protein